MEEDTPDSTSTPKYSIGGGIDPAYYTTSGAFNGSGIALAAQSFATKLSDSVVMYFQHHTGDIRSMQLSNDGIWSGGSISDVIAVDARNNTPLSAVAYSWDEVNTWNVFCEATRTMPFRLGRC